MRRAPILLALVVLGCSALGLSPALAERIVTDQLGKQVAIPDEVTRAVVLQHQTLNLVVQLDAIDKVVGVLEEWQKQLGPNYVRLAPRLADLPMPGGLTKVNIEELLSLRPDLVFVTHYAPAEMIEQIEKVGVPVVAISLFSAPPSETAKLNPTMADEEKSYQDGFAEAVRLIGTVLDREQQAEELIAYATSKRRIVQERLADLDDSERVRIYMANPEMATYGSGKYTGLMMHRAGGQNVASSIVGFKQVSMEDVLQWNPSVIFVQERYAPVVEEIETSPAWQPIDAVKNGRVYLMPEYAKAWGHPMPEALALGELWMAKTLYPERFADIDMQAEADAYYRRFYRTGYEAGH